MLIAIIGLLLALILFFCIYTKEKGNRVLKILLCIFLCLSLSSIVIVFSQQLYISQKLLKINALVTFDNDNYPTTHFVNLYKNTTTNKIYSIHSRCGFYIFREVAISDTAEPIITTKSPFPLYEEIGLYEYS